MRERWIGAVFWIRSSQEEPLKLCAKLGSFVDLGPSRPAIPWPDLLKGGWGTFGILVGRLTFAIYGDLKDSL